MIPLQFLLPVAYALADSFAGGSLGKAAKALDEKLPGRAAFWGALLCAGLGFLSAGVHGALMGLVWLIYRTIPWKVFGGSATPVGTREIAGTFARHLIAMLAVVVVFWAGKPVLPAALLFGWFALMATGLAIGYGQFNLGAQRRRVPIPKGVNTFVEIARGFCFGLAVAFSL